MRLARLWTKKWRFSSIAFLRYISKFCTLSCAHVFIVLKVVASLLYADNDARVQDTNDAEAPLLTSYDGIEYAASDRPSKLISGRASFKLKISQVWQLLVEA